MLNYSVLVVNVTLAGDFNLFNRILATAVDPNSYYSHESLQLKAFDKRINLSTSLMQLQ